MTWLTFLLAAAVLVAVAALIGINPRGARPVAHTGLMGVARLVLLLAVVVLVYLAYRARAGA
jgi:hypothetical protein